MRAPHAPPAEPVRGPSPGPSPSVVAVAQAGRRREVLAGQDVEHWLWARGQCLLGWS